MLRESLYPSSSSRGTSTRPIEMSPALRTPTSLESDIRATSVPAHNKPFTVDLTRASSVRRLESFITPKSVLVDMGRLQRILNAPKVKRNIEKGSELYNAGDIEGARSAFATAVELDDEHYEAQYYLALALSTLKRYEEAEAHFRRSITLKGNEPKSHADYGELLHNTGRKEEAEAEYQRTLELDPTNAIVIVNLGTLLRDSGRFTEASDLYRRALQLPNLDPETRAKLEELGV